MPMALSKWEQGSQIIKEDDQVSSLLILLKGTAQIKISGFSFDVSPGSLIGIGSKPGESYGFSCIAKTETATFSYDYSSVDDIKQIFTENKKIAPAMCEAVLKNTYKLYGGLDQLLDSAKSLYKNITEKLLEYPAICRKTGDNILDFKDLLAYPKPPEETGIADWKIDFIKGLLSFGDRRDEILGNQTALCVGYTCVAVDFIREAEQKVVLLKKYIDDLKNASQKFLIIFSALSSKNAALKTGDTGDMPSFEGLLDRILVYSKAPVDKATDLKNAMVEYKKLSDRAGITDDHRKIRRQLAKVFYPIYEKVILQVIKQRTEPPIDVKMFLMFGLLDETIVTKEELQTLYGYAKSYKPDPTGHVMCAWEWLRKVYNLEVEPSRNEFDMDYPKYLRELRNNGEIDEEQEKKLLKSPRRRLHFELSNMFTIGNRMTFGRMSAFEPVFDDVNAIGSMENGYLYTEKINQELSFVTDRDFSIFYRDDIYSAPELNVMQIPIHREFRPIFILMPNMGSRFVLWQEIEGKRRQSSARILLPIIMSENIRDNMLKLCGEFRWEMCKTEHGVHWNDISDPSLTAEYTDLLQFYKKNSSFTADVKEKIKAELKKKNNNYKNVFVSDYHDYMRYESSGSMRLLKPVREILAKYCPFTGETKDLLKTNPAYESFVERFNNHEAKNRRIVTLTIKRFQKEGIPVPDVLTAEEKYLSH